MANVHHTDVEIQSSCTAEDVPEIKDDQVYSVFRVSQRYGILAIVATAGFLSTLSANIYFPALGVIQNVRRFILFMTSCPSTSY